METDGGQLEFACYLATQLGKTLAELDEMSAHEFMVWSVYFGRKAQRDEIAMAKSKRG